jgi:glycosyltransferase involved in cell wall biosynthesis
MDNQPLVSIGIPTYNRPEGLRRTLGSITNQTYKNLEVIISDNCSTNGDVQTVINEFIQDKRIKYYRQPENKGMVFNFKFVLEKATGDYFKWQADDDWIELNYIESCVMFLENNTEYASAYGVAKIINLGNEFIRDDVEIKLEHPSGQDRVKNYYENVGWNSSFYGLFRRNTLLFLTPEKKIAEDWILFARIAFLGKIKVINKTHYYLSQGGASQTTDDMAQQLDFSSFTRYFPFLQTGFGISGDILWGSQAYGSLNLFRRIILARRCFLIIWERWNVKSEIKKGIKIYLKLKYPNFTVVVKKIRLKFRTVFTIL